MAARVMLFGSWRPMAAAAAVLDRVYKRDRRGRFGSGDGGYHSAGDMSGTADYEGLAKTLGPFDAKAGGDKTLVAIREQQGFNGKPLVVSRQEFDQAVARGEVTETFRGEHGENAAQYAEQYRSGDHFAGSGVYGHGTYVAMDRAGAEGYAAHDGVVTRIGLHKDAKVISQEDLHAEIKAYQAKNAGRLAEVDRLDKEMYKKAWDAESIDEQKAIYADYGARKAKAAGPAYSVNEDEGRFAALRGYDAVKITNDPVPQMLILNRTAVMVEEA